ncbi:MAG: hypothetical protein LC664_01735 [Flavobacteriales bacterium]|nr:hypothetical protein [Flavobacteriales bacterium]
MQLSKDEFHTYLLLSAAHADMEEITDEERNFILSQVTDELYNKVKRIFDADTDVERIERIQENKALHAASSEELNKLLKEIRYFLSTDGKFTSAEEAYYIHMKHILT